MPLSLMSTLTRIAFDGIVVREAAWETPGSARAAITTNNARAFTAKSSCRSSGILVRRATHVRGAHFSPRPIGRMLRPANEDVELEDGSGDLVSGARGRGAAAPA